MCQSSVALVAISHMSVCRWTSDPEVDSRTDQVFSMSPSCSAVTSPVIHWKGRQEFSVFRYASFDSGYMLASVRDAVVWLVLPVTMHLALCFSTAAGARLVSCLLWSLWSSGPRFWLHGVMTLKDMFTPWRSHRCSSWTSLTCPLCSETGMHSVTVQRPSRFHKCSSCAFSFSLCFSLFSFTSKGKVRPGEERCGRSLTASDLNTFTNTFFSSTCE